MRNAHLHAGKFRGSEFVQAAINSSYEDPTFDEARRDLAPIAREAIIEWLRRGGVFTPPSIRKKTLRRWVRERAFELLAVVASVGLLLGWFLRTLWAELIH